MIDLYTWTTPNGRKISIALEEMGLAYKVHTVNISEDEQFKPEFLKLSPNNKVPVILDSDTDTSVFESGAILQYLAEKSGKFLPTDPKARAKVNEWLFWQMAGFGPMLGQLGHFTRYADEQVPYAIKRYTEEAVRLYSVLDAQLSKTEFVAGDYSIADMAIYPWSVVAYDALKSMAGLDLANVERWHTAVGGRPAVQAGMKVPVVD